MYMHTIPGASVTGKSGFFRMYGYLRMSNIQVSSKAGNVKVYASVSEAIAEAENTIENSAGRQPLAVSA